MATGGNDVFVDIGDKSWGVRACQQYFGGIDRTKTLHIGDQFLSAGANDFKVCLPPLFICIYCCHCNACLLYVGKTCIDDSLDC